MLTTPLDIQPMTEHLVAVIALGSPSSSEEQRRLRVN